MDVLFLSYQVNPKEVFRFQLLMFTFGIRLSLYILNIIIAYC